MNLPLSSGGKQKKKGNLGYGLNSRKGNNTGITNVFGDDDDGGDDVSKDDGGENNESSSGRKIVNQQITMEQAALRRRAQAALASAEDPSVYDYDGAYDSFHKSNDKNDDNNTDNVEITAARASKDTRKSSRYIGDLLKAAKVRERERDAIYERRIAREQAEEDAKDEFQGKEKFVTKAYKRKLEERKQWEEEQEEREREEAADDVTKKSTGMAFAGFYGNLNRNVAMGGTNEENAKDDDNRKQGEKMKSSLLDDDFDPRQGFLGDFERATEVVEGTNERDQQKVINNHPSSSSQPQNDVEEQQSDNPMSIRERREKKVAEARIRYFKRKAAAALEQ